MDTRQQKALDFATRKHAGQKRKDGQDYITHPIAVAAIAIKIFNEEYLPKWDDTPADQIEVMEILEELYILSVLHDTYEDTDTTLEEIRELFGSEIAHGVDMLSRKDKSVTYFEFIMKIVGRPWEWIIALVKRADLEHNMSDLKEGQLKEKYRFARYALIQAFRP